MKICVLASGSKGNATYIEDGDTKLLIDVGITYKDLEGRLNSIGVKPEDIGTVLVTDAHSDHVKVLGTFYTKIKPNIFMSSKTYNEINDKIRINIKEYTELPEVFNLGNIKVTSFALSHDVDCHGYILEDKNKSVVYITDTGYLNEQYKKLPNDKEMYIFESNHDTVMNMHSKKPKMLRDRVTSDYGHLSNKEASNYLSSLVDKDTNYILLAHLSEDDNTPDLALETLNTELVKYHKSIKYIKTAYQRVISDVIEL